MKLTFLGAAETVTGSKFLVETGGSRVLVDCGLYQGLKPLRLRNWEPLPVEPASIDAVVLTHAHLDHSGYLPALVRHGFSGPVYVTPGTRALLGILLPDAGYLQEEAARYANERGFSKHAPAKPLYTLADAERSLSTLRSVPFDTDVEVGDARVRFSRVGHILGAACARLEAGGVSVLFSGDVGRDNGSIMKPPAPPLQADYAIVESTYGNRRHPDRDPLAELAGVVRRTAERGGVVLIPSFAVGRAQTVLHLLAKARGDGLVPDLPVFLNSPMATSATRVYQEFSSELRLTPEECAAAFDRVEYVRGVDDSKALNRREGPMVIISASGMATGGRVLHHLERFAPDRRNSIVFVGYQAAGTRGEAILNGVDRVKIHGSYVPVRAEVAEIETLSAHADYQELLDWLRPMRAPRRAFLVHGEPSALDAFRRHVRDFLGWQPEIPSYQQTVDLE